MIYRNKNLLSNHFKKFNEKSVSHTNNIFNNKKLICQNYTTKIINNHMRENKFLNSTNLKNKRKAHSTSISKNEKYNLNSLIHNDNIYNMINEKKNKSPYNKIKKNYKANFYDHHLNNIITLTNCLNNNHKLKTKNQLLRNSINICSIGVSLIKTKDSKDGMNSENNFSKSSSKNKNSNINIKTNNNIKYQNNKSNYINSGIIRQKKISYNKIEKSNKKMLKKLKTVSPFGNNYNKPIENSNISSNKKSNYYWNNRTKKKNLQNNKSLDNQKAFFKKKKIKEASANKNFLFKYKNKIISRNVGNNNINNNLIKNNTNITLNTEEIFNNNKLNNLTITNMNKNKEQMSRNIINNFISFSGKSKNSNMMNNTNSYLNNHDYLKILSNLNKNKGVFFTNSNSNYNKKAAILKGSKSKNNIYLKNNLFNKPFYKLSKKKN
jgi:hypothetical protein